MGLPPIEPKAPWEEISSSRLHSALSVLYSMPFTITLPKPVIGPAAAATPVLVMPPVGGGGGGGGETGGGGGETPPPSSPPPLLPPQAARSNDDNARIVPNFAN